MKYVDAVSRVLLRAKGCTEDNAAEALRDACIRWCKETYCLVNPLEVTSSEAAPEVLAIDLSDTWVVAIIDARIDGREVSVLSANDPDVARANGYDPVIVFADPSAPVIVPAPSAPTTVELQVAVAPGQESDEFPEVLWQRYRKELEHGAIGDVLMQAGAKWVNPQLGAYHLGEFQRAIKAEAALIGRNRVTNAQRLRTAQV